MWWIPWRSKHQSWPLPAMSSHIKDDFLKILPYIPFLCLQMFQWLSIALRWMQNFLTLPWDPPCAGLYWPLFLPLSERLCNSFLIFYYFLNWCICLPLLSLLISAHFSFRFSFLLSNFSPQGLFKCSPLFLQVSPVPFFTIAFLKSQFRFSFPWKIFPELLSRIGYSVVCCHSNPCYPIIVLAFHCKSLFNVQSILLDPKFHVCPI